MNKKDYTRYLRVKKDYDINTVCQDCGEIEPLIMKRAEKHHREGKANSDITEWLCLNCHTFVTEKQNQVITKKRNKKTTKKNLTAFAILTLGASIERIGKMLQKIGWRMFEDG